MFRLLSLFILSMIIFSFNSCSDHANGNGLPQVRIENGEKWIANPETTEGISNMQNLVSTFKPGEHSLENRQELKNKLDDEFKNIFKQCTMKGEAHNQLHNYLVPMKSLLKDIDAKDNVLAENTIVKLEQHLATYKSNFK